MQLRDQLAASERRLQIAGIELLDRDAALAARAGDADARAERTEERRQVHMGIAMREVSTERGDIANPNVRERAQRAREHRPAAAHARVGFKTAERHHGADAQATLA